MIDKLIEAIGKATARSSQPGEIIVSIEDFCRVDPKGAAKLINEQQDTIDELVVHIYSSISRSEAMTHHLAAVRAYAEEVNDE